MNTHVPNLDNVRISAAIKNILRTTGKIWFTYINDASSMSREDKILLQVLVPRTFIESASGDNFVVFNADMLFEEQFAVKSEEDNLRAAAEHDDARYVVDASTLLPSAKEFL